MLDLDIQFVTCPWQQILVTAHMNSQYSTAPPLLTNHSFQSMFRPFINIAEYKKSGQASSQIVGK